MYWLWEAESGVPSVDLERLPIAIFALVRSADCMYRAEYARRRESLLIESSCPARRNAIRLVLHLARAALVDRAEPVELAVQE